MANCRRVDAYKENIQVLRAEMHPLATEEEVQGVKAELQDIKTELAVVKWIIGASVSAC